MLRKKNWNSQYCGCFGTLRYDMQMNIHNYKLFWCENKGDSRVLAMWHYNTHFDSHLQSLHPSHIYMVYIRMCILPVFPCTSLTELGLYRPGSLPYGLPPFVSHHWGSNFTICINVWPSWKLLPSAGRQHDSQTFSDHLLRWVGLDEHLARLTRSEMFEGVLHVLANHQKIWLPSGNFYIANYWKLPFVVDLCWFT